MTKSFAKIANAKNKNKKNGCAQHRLLYVVYCYFPGVSY